MTVRPIVLWPDPLLAQVCAPIQDVTQEIETLAADMLETMYAAPGRGLAAPQVGTLERLFVMDITWKEGAPDPIVFINPELKWTSEAQITQSEGCLSIPGVTAEVRRPAQVKLAWTDLQGQACEETFRGFAAACVQHELDHLNGTLTFDHLTPADREALMLKAEGR